MTENAKAITLCFKKFKKKQDLIEVKEKTSGILYKGEECGNGKGGAERRDQRKKNKRRHYQPFS
jgi:hypothetical protein